MNTKRNKTYNAKPLEIDPDWKIMDAADKPLGRFASEIALILQGKHRPTYTPHTITGDFVIVVNAAKIDITGRKRANKIYYRYSGYPGGLRQTTFSQMIEKHPDRTIRHAVKGMLPKTTLGQRMLKRLKIYAGPDHPHDAQVIGAQKRNEKTAQAAQSS